MTSRQLAMLAVPLILAASCDARIASPPAVDPDSAVAAHIPAIPLAGRVTDAAEILNPAQEAALTAKLEELEHKTKHQMVIVTVPSLEGQDIAIYTRDLANRWGIGREGQDDGVVLLVAPNERKIRIAVGYGVERTLTAEVCARIINEKMIPRFSKGDLPGGVGAGADAIIAIMK